MTPGPYFRRPVLYREVDERDVDDDLADRKRHRMTDKQVFEISMNVLLPRLRPLRVRVVACAKEISSDQRHGHLYRKRIFDSNRIPEGRADRRKHGDVCPLQWLLFLGRQRIHALLQCPVACGACAVDPTAANGIFNDDKRTPSGFEPRP